jgi:hypothetical protein
MIKPTIGRIVWLHFDPKDGPPGFADYDPAQPFSAQIAFVHNDTMVNLGVFDHAGQHWAFENVLLWQGEGERPQGRYCEWMPYQKGQAAKTDAAEAHQMRVDAENKRLREAQAGQRAQRS